MREVAIYTGSDWTDASAEHVRVPDELVLEEAQKRYGEWYRNEYCGAALRPTGQIAYMTFRQWLMSREGCLESEIEEYHIE